MKLLIDVPEMTEDELAELTVVTSTLAKRMEFSVELRWFAQSPTRLNVLRAERADRRALSEVCWAPYQEHGIADPAKRKHEPPDVPVRIRATGYQPDPGDIGETIVVYWEAA